MRQVAHTRGCAIWPPGRVQEPPSPRRRRNIPHCGVIRCPPASCFYRLSTCAFERFLGHCLCAFERHSRRPVPLRRPVPRASVCRPCARRPECIVLRRMPAGAVEASGTLSRATLSAAHGQGTSATGEPSNMGPLTLRWVMEDLMAEARGIWTAAGNNRWLDSEL